MANGRRVVLEGSKSTRHIIAGLAQALTGAAADKAAGVCSHGARHLPGKLLFVQSMRVTCLRIQSAR
jgi:hypothetical protein